MDMISLDDVCSSVRSLARTRGTRQLGLDWDIDPSYISRVAAGLQEPGPKILHNLGLERIVSYRKTRSK